MQPDPEKVAALKTAPTPTSAKTLTSFLCMAGWNATFIHRFSAITQPLRELTRKPEFKWEQEHEQAFRTLQEALCKDALNNYFVVGRKTFVFTDAGKTGHDSTAPGGLAAILVQEDPQTKEPLVIHYASRSINDVESRWGQVELEARAIRFALDKFRFYLEGSPPFTVYCDCQALVPLFKKISQQTPPRILRQILALQDLQFTLVFWKGSKNPADWPSRCPLTDTSDLDEAKASDDLDHCLIRTLTASEDGQKTIAIAKLREAITADDDMKILIKCIQNNDWKQYRKLPAIAPYVGIQSQLSYIDGLILKGQDTLVIPTSLRPLVTKMVHKLGHQGENNTTRLLSEYFWFPGITNYVKAHISECEVCQRLERSTALVPMGITTTPAGPMIEVVSDFKGPLRDGTYVLVIIDLFSRWPEIFFTKSTSYEANERHFLNFFATYGTVTTFRSDNGSPYSSHQFAKLLQEKGIRHILSIPAWPQQAGAAEVFMKSLKKAYEIADLTGRNYKKVILDAVLAKRATPHTSTSVSPHTALTGRKMNLGFITGFLFIKNPGQTLARDRQIQQNLFKSKMANKIRHDSRRNVHEADLRPGDYATVRLKEGGKPEKELFRIVRIRGTDVIAVSEADERVVRRHIERFRRVLLPKTPSQAPQTQMNGSMARFEPQEEAMHGGTQMVPRQPPMQRPDELQEGAATGRGEHQERAPTRNPPDTTARSSSLPSSSTGGRMRSQSQARDTRGGHSSQGGGRVKFQPHTRVREYSTRDPPAATGIPPSQGPSQPSQGPPPGSAAAGTRSRGSAPNLPNVMPAELERSSQYRGQAERIIRAHDPQSQQDS